MSDNGSSDSRRSSSQASRNSNENKKPKTLRGPPKRTGSKNSQTQKTPDAEDESLTSFPSFSPEIDQKTPRLPSETFAPQQPVRTISQKRRDRKATLAGLTSASPSFNRQNALFDDSPRSSLDIPGSLHLATDEHIERLIAKTGALKLVKQYAADLAQRDAEISALRVRADNRERELKRLLREASVPTPDVEKRLLQLERGSLPDPNAASERSASTSTLDGMMSEAMTEGLISTSPLDAGIVPSIQKDVANRSRDDSLGSNKISVGTGASRTPSRANSILSQSSQDMDATVRPRVPSSNAPKSLQAIFSPPASSTNSTSYFIGGKTVSRSQKLGDEASVRSNHSGRSFASWTQIFGGKSQATRSRASSVGHDSPDKPASDAAASLNTLAKIRNNSTSASKSATSLPGTNSGKVRPVGKRQLTTSKLSSTPNHVRKGSNASSLPPTVELDSMIESSELPPTMKASRIDSHGHLTDRFGFIYDQKRQKRQAVPGRQQHKRNKLSAAETIGSFRTDTPQGDEQGERPSTPLSVDEDAPKKAWQDYLKVTSTNATGRPRELLTHTPSAGAVVTVNTSEASGTITPPRVRDTSITFSAATNKALPTTSVVTEPQSSTITAAPGDFANDESESVDASRLLLEQLSELHDALQSERAVRWNDFLRRVRAERAANIAERPTNNVPEADLTNGELIGIATLGRSTKTKYLHFKSLVLTGIPVALRPKIWAECSGATALRIPGYYEDLVATSEENGVDPDIANQIKADVRRTLTDNVFFRNGPGVQRLEELLRAYSLHNPVIGYCQGMNLITASLLLICATAEDCFWLLVAIIDVILPSGYFSSSLLVARADQVVLRQYVAEILPRLSEKFEELGVELEACTFHWFLSLYTGVLTGGEALYRVWDVVLCLNSSSDAPLHITAQNTTNNPSAISSLTSALTPAALTASAPISPVTPNAPHFTASAPNDTEHDGTSSPFLFQLALALLKLNENALLQLTNAAQVYTYINHNMTNHAISIDALVSASEGLRTRVKRQEVLERRAKAVAELGG